MMEGSVPDFNDKPFCHSFSMPAGNMALNEMIAGERKGVQTFFASSSTHLSRKKTTKWVLLWEITLHLSADYQSA